MSYKPRRWKVTSIAPSPWTPTVCSELLPVSLFCCRSCLSAWLVKKSEAATIANIKEPDYLLLHL